MKLCPSVSAAKHCPGRSGHRGVQGSKTFEVILKDLIEMNKMLKTA